jgi:hypothetical protein
MEISNKLAKSSMAPFTIPLVSSIHHFYIIIRNKLARRVYGILQSQYSSSLEFLGSRSYDVVSIL